MTFWNWVQAVGSAFGVVSFIALLSVVVLHEKFKDWVAGGAEARKHHLDLVKEHDRSNTEIRREVIQELFRRKIQAHDKIRLHIASAVKAANAAIAAARIEEPKENVRAARLEANKLVLAGQFMALAELADVSLDTERELNDLMIYLNVSVNLGKWEGSGSIKEKLAGVRNSMRAELDSLYRDGFDNLLK